MRISHNRNPGTKHRPSFRDTCSALCQDENTVLGVPNEALLSHPQAGLLSYTRRLYDFRAGRMTAEIRLILLAPMRIYNYTGINESFIHAVMQVVQSGCSFAIESELRCNYSFVMISYMLITDNHIYTFAVDFKVITEIGSHHAWLWNSNKSKHHTLHAAA